MTYNLNYAYKLMEKYNLEALIAIAPNTLKYFGFNPWINHTEEWMFKPGGSNVGAMNNMCVIPYKKEPFYILSAELLTFLSSMDFKKVYPYGIFNDLTSSDCNHYFKELNYFNNEIEIKISEIFKKGIFKDCLSALTAVIRESKLENSRMGIEKNGLSKILFEKILKKFPKCEFINSTELFRILRMVKSSEELKLIEKCAVITELALNESLKILSPKKTFGEIISRFKDSLYKNHANFEHFIYLPKGLGCLSNYNYPIENNYIFGIDVGAILNNYISDTAVTIFLGKYDHNDLEIYKKLLDIIYTGLDTTKPGICCKEIYQSMLNKQEKYGLKNCKFEGHGIGLSCREYPVINKEIGYYYFDGFDRLSSDFMLEENMVFNIEINMHIFGTKTFQIEKTASVTKNGVKKIQCQDRDLPVMIET